jgi:hypothetical protein
MKRVRVEGEIYCLVHGCVHDDTTDPYQSEDDRCPESCHRPLYWNTRVGDWENDG